MLQSQDEYYRVLAQCDADAGSIEYSLQLIPEAIDVHIKDVSGKPLDTDARLDYAKSDLQLDWFSRN